MRIPVAVMLAAISCSLHAAEDSNEEDAYFPQTLTANELLMACSASSLTETGRKRKSYCKGFISGVEEGVRMFGYKSGTIPAPGFCVKPGSTSSQLAKAYIKYTSDKRPDLGRPASLVVIEALKSEYPC